MFLYLNLYVSVPSWGEAMYFPLVRRFAWLLTRWLILLNEPQCSVDLLRKKKSVIMLNNCLLYMSYICGFDACLSLFLYILFWKKNLSVCKLYLLIKTLRNQIIYIFPSYLTGLPSVHANYLEWFQDWTGACPRRMSVSMIDDDIWLRQEREIEL